MTKVQFLHQLEKKLSKLPAEERKEAIEYYTEIIDDRIEDAMTESAAVATLGTVDSVYEQIIASTPIHALIKHKITSKKSTKVWKNILLFFGFLVFGLPFMVSVFAVIVALLATLWSVVLCMCSATLSLGVGGVGSVIIFFPTTFTGSPFKSLFTIGTGIFSLGLIIPFFYLAKWSFKFAIFSSKGIITSTKKTLVGE